MLRLWFILTINYVHVQPSLLGRKKANRWVKTVRSSLEHKSTHTLAHSERRVSKGSGMVPTRGSALTTQAGPLLKAPQQCSTFAPSAVPDQALALPGRHWGHGRFAMEGSSYQRKNYSHSFTPCQWLGSLAAFSREEKAPWPQI